MTALLILAASLSAPPPAVAFVLEVRGEVSVERDGKPAPLDDGDPLRPGDKLTVPAGGGVKVYFKPSGPVAEMSGPGAAVVQAGKLESGTMVAVRDAIVPAKAAERLGKDIEGGKIGGMVLRPLFPVPDPPALRPIVGATVRDPHPRFVWPAVAGATEYRIELLVRLPGSTERSLWKTSVAEPRATYPLDARPLKPDAEYTWRVTAVTADGMKPAVTVGKFRILDEGMASDLARLAEMRKSDDPADWMLAAEAYSACGLYDEAVEVYEKLAEKRPKSAGVWRILSRYYDLAGRQDDAKKAQAKAELLAKR